MYSGEPVYLFVYGTLRKDYQSPIYTRISDRIEWVGYAQIKGILYDIGDYPGATRTEDQGSVIIGELIQLTKPEEVFVELDEYEGYDPEHTADSEFCRSLEEVKLENGRMIKASIYWYNFEVIGMARIAGGNYLHYLKKNKRGISYGALQYEPESESLEAEK